jgi:hypothetical protein
MGRFILRTESLSADIINKTIFVTEILFFIDSKKRLKELVVIRHVNGLTLGKIKFIKHYKRQSCPCS